MPIVLSVSVIVLSSVRVAFVVSYTVIIQLLSSLSNGIFTEFRIISPILVAAPQLRPNHHSKEGGNFNFRFFSPFGVDKRRGGSNKIGPK